MKNPFDKSFFGFSLALAAILVASFTIIYIAGSYKSNQAAGVSEVKDCLKDKSNSDC